MTELAPLNRERNHEGTIRRKPWEYCVTATMAHLETPDSLAVVLELLRAQTERPYLVVVDTGSSPATRERLEALRADDCEIHYICGHGWKHGSSVIAAACDLAMVTCRTEYLFMTHTDAFLRRPGFLFDLCSLCGPDSPVVGYEMSPRGDPRWKGMVGHTATMLHMPTMRRIGATWDMERGAEHFDLPYLAPAHGWPDTETTFNAVLQRNYIRPVFIGHDENGTNYVDDNLRHCRSYGIAAVYGCDLQERSEWIADAMAEARRNLADWRAERGLRCRG